MATENLKPKSGSEAETGMSGMWDTVKTVVYAVLIALFIRTVAYEPFNIPSGSMIPTLLVGDYLFVSKFSYGYSHHALPLSPRIFSGRVFDAAPERGDVIVFKLPRDNETDYIKRVIGLPGSTSMENWSNAIR
jgi:signal peptidase I